MKRFKSNQKLLFKAETVFNLKPLEKYEIIFSFLGTSSLEILYPSTGRPPIPYKALLKALIYKNIKNIAYLSDLVRELQDNPDLALVFGFHPLRLPCVENFSAFLGDTENSIFQEVRGSLASKLIELKEIKELILPSILLTSWLKLKKTTSRLLSRIDLVRPRDLRVIRNLGLVSWSISPSLFRKSLNTSGVTGILSSLIPYLNYPI